MLAGGVALRCSAQPPISKAEGGKGQGAAQYTEDQFFQLFLTFRKPEDALRRIGKAAAKENHPPVTFWYYRIPVTLSNGTVACPVLHQEGGKFSTLSYLSPEAMEDKIAAARTRDRLASKPKRRTYTAAEVEALVKFRTAEEVKAALGEPSARTVREGKEVWKYAGLLSGNGKKLMNLSFDYGRVQQIWSE